VRSASSEEVGRASGEDRSGTLVATGPGRAPGRCAEPGRQVALPRNEQETVLGQPVGMDGVADLRGAGVVPAGGADLGSRSHRAGVRRLFELPVERAGDCAVRIQASAAGRCALCRSAYAAGDLIGHSREADGWVAACCL